MSSAARACPSCVSGARIRPVACAIPLDPAYASRTGLSKNDGGRVADTLGGAPREKNCKDESLIQTVRMDVAQLSVWIITVT